MGEGSWGSSQITTAVWWKGVGLVACTGRRPLQLDWREHGLGGKRYKQHMSQGLVWSAIEKQRFMRKTGFSLPIHCQSQQGGRLFYFVPLYVLSIPVTSWSEMTVGVSAVSSQLHILDSRRGQHPPFWRTFSRICLCRLLSFLWLELSHMTVLGGREDWGAVFIPGECGPRYMWVLCSGRRRRWILETDSPIPAKVPTEADHAWALCLYPKSSRRLLRCFKKGDMIRFSFRRDHFGSSVGNVFEEGVVKGMRWHIS